jgi:hypothetical protein
VLQFEEGHCHVLASDTRSSLASIDRAIGTGATIMGTMVETFAGAGLPAGRAQKLYERAYRSLGRVIEGRGEMVSLVSELTVVQRHSNVAEVSFGCSTPWDEMFTLAEAEGEIVNLSKHPTSDKIMAI